MAYKLLHASDYHLGALFSGMPGNRGNERRDDLLKTFEDTLVLAEEKNVDAILIAGDIFNSENPGRYLSEFVSRKFREIKHIPIYVIPGNHDPITSNSVWKKTEFPSNVHIFDQEGFTVETLDDLAIYGCPYDPKNPGKRVLNDVPEQQDFKYSIGLVHGSYNVISDRIGDNYFPIEGEDFSKCYFDYFALGHYHSYYQIPVFKNAYYSGSPEGLNFKETGDRFVLYVELSNNGPMVEPIKTNRKVFWKETIDCSDFINNHEIIDTAGGLSEKCDMLKLILEGTPKIESEIDLEYVAESLRSTLFHVEIEDRIHIPEDYQIDNTIRGIFIKKMYGAISEAEAPDERKLLEDALRYGVSAIDGRSGR
jgi:DNA repair protein SbcD/Mre11